MDGGRVADSYRPADHCRHAAIDVHDHDVLDVRVPPHDNRIEVPTEHGTMPDARALIDGHVSDEDRARGDVDHRVTRGSRAHSSRACRTRPRRRLAPGRARTVSITGTASAGR